MVGIVVSFLVMLLISFYAFYQWWKCIDMWYVSAIRCIKLEAEISQLKAEVRELERNR